MSQKSARVDACWKRRRFFAPLVASVATTFAVAAMAQSGGAQQGSSSQRSRARGQTKDQGRSSQGQGTPSQGAGSQSPGAGGAATQAPLGPDVQLSCCQAKLQAAGKEHTCVVTGGQLKCWGSNEFGQLGVNCASARETRPMAVADVAGVVSVSASYHTCVATSEGRVVCWGENGKGQLGAPAQSIGGSGSQSGSGGAGQATGGASQGQATSGQASQGGGAQGSSGAVLQTNPAASCVKVTVPGIADAAAVSVGREHSCALSRAGAVRCWGNNASGQLGDGTKKSSHIPVAVVGLSRGIVALALGREFSCALTDRGAVLCWGKNDHGTLGDGSESKRNTPGPVAVVTRAVREIAAGREHACALTSAGGLKCWGYNHKGRLGDGTETNRKTPVDALGLTSGVVAMALGREHTCARLAAGGLKCWGKNDSGQLGDGGRTNRGVPGDVADHASGVEWVTAGGFHTCAKSAGGMKCWGYNNRGQLGDGTTSDRKLPVRVVE
ncbi:MAG: hypothetical protein HYY84_05440 [Deltaproteobacteria bacterium]|nr:hypothetical protein [Deltaproteobacteria bacterium]